MSNISKIAVGGTEYDISGVAMIATIQSTLVAVKSYAVGDQFVYNGLLYEVTSAIASGGTITIGGNCQLADTVTDQIGQINADLSAKISGFGTWQDVGDQIRGSGFTSTSDGFLRIYVIPETSSPAYVAINIGANTAMRVNAYNAFAEFGIFPVEKNVKYEFAGSSGVQSASFRFLPLI